MNSMSPKAQHLFNIVFFVLLIAIMIGITSKAVKTRRTLAKELATMQATYEKEKSTLEAELQKVQQEIAARARRPLSETDPELTPEALLRRLNSITNETRTLQSGLVVQEFPGPGQLQKISFCCEGFVISGTNSVPALKEYLDSGNKVNLFPYFYIFQGAKSDEYNRDAEKLGNPQNASPASSRVAVAYALRDIGGREAFGLLNGMLQSPADMLEALQVGNLLLQSDDTQFHAAAVKVFHNLLTEAKDADETAIILSYLHGMGGTAYADALVGLSPFNKDGSVNAALLSYMLDALHSKAIPTILEAFKTVGTQAERIDLLRKAMNDLDGSPESVEMINTVFQEILKTQPEKAAALISPFILNLAGEVEGDTPWAPGRMQSTYPGGFMLPIALSVATMVPNGTITAEQIARMRQFAYLDPEISKERLALMDTLETQFGSDEMISKSIAVTRHALECAANPTAEPEAFKPDYSFLTQMDTSLFIKKDSVQRVIIRN